MCAGIRAKRHGRFAVYIVAALAAVVVLGASFGLMGYIDHKLKQGAEQQVVTFTQQTAGNVSDRIYVIQNTIGAFEVQSADPAAVVPALKSLRDRFNFVEVAFAGMDGKGYLSDGEPFSVDEVVQPETALSQGKESYSPTFTLEDGRGVRMAQRPLYLDGRQVGALYVQIPLSMFSMPQKLDMFDGRGYFILFQKSTGEILVPPSEETKTPIREGMTVYSFLDQAADYEPVAGESSLADSVARSLDNDTESLSALAGTVAAGETGLAVGLVDGKDSYVCVSPVAKGGWYVCNVIPVENVRAEASIVLTAFKVVFALVVLCFAAVIALMFSAYRKRMLERNVAMKSRLYKALSDSLDMAVNLYCPSDGVVTPIVAKAVHILGFTMPEIMADRRIADQLELSDEGSSLLDRLRDDAVDGLQQGEFSFVHVQTGKVRWIAYSASPLDYEDKRRIMVVFRDVTVEKELQLSMKDAMTAAEAANQAKSEFLSRMSHEIRTPMNAIIGMLQIAKLHADESERTAESLGKIGAASDHLLNLINDVLDISKIESGKMVLASEPFRLSVLMDRVAAVIRPQCEQRRQTLEVVMPADDEVFVGDAVRLRQMLINLLTNSVKYTPEKGHVRLEATVGSDSIVAYRCVAFVVADDGIGMTEEFQEHLFEPFAMESRSTSQGTGLGMPIVKNIVTMMGGDIHVRTAVDQGTTFTVAVSLRVAFEPERHALEEAEHAGTAWDDEFDVSGRPRELPSSSALDVAYDGLYNTKSRVPGPVSPDSDPEAADAAGPATAPLPSATCPPGTRVLLVEDNDLNAEIARELLGESGLVVEWAENGEVACRMFDESEEGYYDVVLMDVQMPVMNGYEATRCIRALDRADVGNVPIIAMSANAFAEDVRASLESGMDAHLSKPIDMHRVMEAIALHLRKRRG
ncbi:PAS domain-containing sensor histidine kinase [Gordonibacter sp. 28C]|uniref:ATP-binding protein n=1 Tax=Gordonibacter sp. 28C TaxID=2078569 RepID=UPI000DF7AB11|nr:ATP-binding protein [Gordonibacter sp. 28C]RDB61329.1 PAS domain-containing sensor histidine kinase [Gordonibacter sp. 28C]